jgi:hypothetical protein
VIYTCNSTCLYVCHAAACVALLCIHEDCIIVCADITVLLSMRLQVQFREYAQVGKGRDVGMQQIYKFEAKLAQVTIYHII